MASMLIMGVKGSLTNCLTIGFRVHPNYGNDLRKQYNIQLSLLAKSTILQHIVSAILERSVTIGKSDPDLWKDILDADYPLS